MLLVPVVLLQYLSVFLDRVVLKKPAKQSESGVAGRTAHQLKGLDTLRVPKVCQCSRCCW